MPTPEFDKNNASTLYEQSVLNEKLVRENQIAVEGMDIIRKRLEHCALTEGVNQFENCQEIRHKYFDLCNDRFRGMRFPEGKK